MENKDSINNALDFFKKNDYKSAIIQFNKALEETPDDFNILNNIGLCYYKLAEDNKAEEFYLKALQHNNQAPQIYINLSDLYYKSKRFGEGASLLETAVTVMPDNLVLMHYLARFYIEDIKYDLAIDILNRILDISPENIDAYWDLANISYETGDYENAVAAYEHVLEKRDDNAIFFYRTGLAYEAMDNIERAISNYLKAIAVNSDMAQAYKKLAVMFLAQGDKESATEYLEDYLKFDLPQEEKDNINSILANINN